MGSSRTTVMARGGATLVFLPPNLLDELVEDGCVRSRSAFIGPDRDHELEASEDAAKECSGDCVVEAELSGEEDPQNMQGMEERDPFYDLRGFSLDSVDQEDDPQEDLLRRIGALSKSGR